MNLSLRRRVRALERAQAGRNERTLTDFLREIEDRRGSISAAAKRAVAAPWTVEKARAVLLEPDTAEGVVASLLQLAARRRARRVLQGAACPAS